VFLSRKDLVFHVSLVAVLSLATMLAAVPVIRALG
jgi:hypothetical protein